LVEKIGSARIKPPTCRKSLTTFIPYHIKLYRVHLAWVWFDLATLVVIDTDCIVSLNTTILLWQNLQIFANWPTFFHILNLFSPCYIHLCSHTRNCVCRKNVLPVPFFSNCICYFCVNDFLCWNDLVQDLIVYIQLSKE
jgi:hypothetical protein